MVLSVAIYQTIEYAFMQMMNTSGEPMTGRGITEAVVTRWILGMVYLQSICYEESCHPALNLAHPDLR